MTPEEKRQQLLQLQGQLGGTATAPSYGQASQADHVRKRLELLEAAGQIRPGEQQTLDALRQSQPAIAQEVGGTQARYRGALQGATLQQADEIYGLFGGDKAGSRAANAAAEQQFPDEYQSGKTAGTIGTTAAIGAATAPFATGAGLLGTMARGAGLGGAEGFAWGSGGSEGLPEKIKEGGKTGLIGALAGGVAPAIVAGGAKVLGAGRDLATGGFDAMVNRPSPKKAQRAMLETAQKSGKSPQEIATMVSDAQRLGLHDYRSVDAMGAAGQRRASGVTRSGGPGAEELEAFLRQRQMDAPDRMAGHVDEAFGLNGQTAEQYRGVVKKNRKNVADTLFDEAAKDAKPVDVRRAVDTLDRTIAQMSNSGIKPPKVVKEYQKLRKQLAGATPDGEPTTLSDYRSVLGIWRETRDKVKKSFRAGDGAVGEALAPIRDALQQALEESSDLYRFATDNYREGSKVLEGFDTGADMATRGRSADNLSLFDMLTDQQKKAARIGYGDKVIDEIERNKAKAPDVSRAFGSSKRKAEAGAMALPEAHLPDKLAREGEMFGTYNRALGGSRTADNLQDVGNVGPWADAGRAVRDAASANFGQALTNAANAIAPYVKGQNEATRTLIARALMSNNPMAILRPAIKSKKNADRVKRIVEGAMRGAHMSERVED